MVYDSNIPQTGDNLSTSQGQILENFSQLNLVFTEDHFAFNDSVVANRGLHRKVSLPVTTTVSAPAGTASVIYNKNVSSVASPYFRNAIGDFAMWVGGTTSNGQATTTLANPGQLNLPNGFQLRWGTDAFVGTNATRSVTFTPAFTTNCLVAIVSIDDSNPQNAVGADTYSSSGFNARRNTPPSGNLNFRWFALGY